MHLGQIFDLRSFSRFQICCNLHVFFPPNVHSQNFRVHKQMFFSKSADLLTELNNDEGGCRTAPATPGLLINEFSGIGHRLLQSKKWVCTGLHF